MWDVICGGILGGAAYYYLYRLQGKLDKQRDEYFELKQRVFFLEIANGKLVEKNKDFTK